MTHIGQLIKKIRLDKNLTQGELASLMGQKQPTIVRWETGKLTISQENLKRLAAALDLTPKYFYDKLDQVSPDVLETAINRLKILPAKRQLHVIELIDFLSKPTSKK